MKSLFKKKKLIFAGVGISFFIGLILYLSFDAYYVGNYFRTMQDDIPASEKVDLRGLRELNVSGGRAPRFADLERRLSHIKLKKIIIDVKSEPHGYIYGIPTTFLGYGLSSPGYRHYLRRLFWTGSVNDLSDRMISEEEEGKKYGYDYKSVNIGSKFTAIDKNIDEIVDFLDNLPPDVWAHIHCTNGRGRTSMILVMLDMLRNAPTVSLADIVKRQQLLGSVDLFNTVVWKRGTYNKKQLEVRKKFIEDFYVFVTQRKAGGIQKWSTWNQQRSVNKVSS